MATGQNIADREPLVGRQRVRRTRPARGMTLVEVAMAAAILVVAALGALRCQYYAAAHGDVAQAESAAARLAQLFIEDWKSSGGAKDYDPTDLNLGLAGPLAVPSDFTTPNGLGTILNGAVYSITVNGAPMQMMLKYLDVTQNGQATALRQIAVIVRFAGTGSNTPDARLAGMPPITLATYVRVDASNG